VLHNHHHRSSGAGTIGQQWPTYPEKLTKNINCNVKIIELGQTSWTAGVRFPAGQICIAVISNFPLLTSSWAAVVKLPEFLYKTVHRECRYLQQFGFYEMLKLSISFVIALHYLHFQVRRSTHHKFNKVTSSCPPFHLPGKGRERRNPFLYVLESCRV
jgi:hypothetical protein